MKLNGFVGKGSGKLGSSVFAISGGEQIVRQYNPQVANPSTDAQVNQRAKLKLMSQLAAALAGAIAFRKKGLVSARNQFVSKNIGLCTYSAEDGAECSLMELDLTGGALSLPEVQATDGSGSVTVTLKASAPADIARVVYVGCVITDDNKLELKEIQSISTPGAGRTFSASLGIAEGNIVVYAFGIKDANASVTTKFENYEASATERNAALAVLRSLSASDYTLSVTRSTHVEIA